MEMLVLKDLMNKNLLLSNYSGVLKNLTLTYLVLEPNNKGVNWKERKYYKRSEQKYFIDIGFPDYERFCKASKSEALTIMAEQTLRASQKFLSKEKNFDHEAFRKDLTDLLRKENIIHGTEE